MVKSMHVLSFKRRLQLLEFLKTITTPDPTQEGIVSYDATWDDEKVAAHCECTKANVRNLRREMLGNLRSETKPALDKVQGIERIQALEERLNAEVAYSRMLAMRVGYLERALGVKPDEALKNEPDNVRIAAE